MSWGPSLCFQVGWALVGIGIVALVVLIAIFFLVRHLDKTPLQDGEL